ncbi:hypothetical protein IAT38_006917 [Cryptococcus sp. DSM 104549]
MLHHSTHAYPWKRETSPVHKTLESFEEGDEASESRPSLAAHHRASSSSSTLTPSHPTSSSTSATLPRPKRHRSRTSTLTSTYTPPLPPVMSRENSAEDVREGSAAIAGAVPPYVLHAQEVDLPDLSFLSRSAEAGPSRIPRPSSSTGTSVPSAPAPPGPSGTSATLPTPTHNTRRASKSVSSVRPQLLVTPSRPQTYYTPQTHTHPAFLGSPSLGSPEVEMRGSLKRRTSTPSLYKRFSRAEEDEDDDAGEGEGAGAGAAQEWETGLSGANSQGKVKSQEVRARSTSTSVVVPQTQDLTENSTFTFPTRPASAARPPLPASFLVAQPGSMPQAAAWAPTAMMDEAETLPATSQESSRTVGLLNAAYDLTETSLHRLYTYIRPSAHPHPGGYYHTRRTSSDADDSEKGLNGSEDETLTFESENTTRASEESVRRGGRYWLSWGSEGEGEAGGEGYFSLPATPPENTAYAEFEAALHRGAGGAPLPASATLPTPALSAKSLSRGDSKREKLRKALRRSPSSRRSRVGIAAGDEGSGNGWLTAVWTRGSGSGSGSGKMREVLRELGWTVGLLVATFFVTAGIVLWLIQGMPITTLKHIPQSTTDLQLLSAEIRSYMAGSAYGWWHTVAVLTLVGCWKHAWSVPGAVVLNILVGSLLDPIPAVALLTLITASGSLGAYMLSRPLAPLIAVLFPKPLALVRAALTPDSIPAPDSATIHHGDTLTITPIQASSDPSAQPIGGPTAASAIWRRLLIMRAMGFVPWSGMNVACGVVGVDWKVFWVTTAAGSASWSYVTASVGNILARLSLPTGALAAGVGEAGEVAGESLTSLLRDPVLIFKLVVLSALTLLPVVLKRRGAAPSGAGGTPRSASSFELTDLPTPSTSSSSSLPTGPAGPSKPLHSQLNALRQGLGLDNPPMSPLSQSLASFTPTPRAFDLLSFGRIAVRQSGRAVLGGVRGVVGGVRGVVRGVAQGGA